MHGGKKENGDKLRCYMPFHHSRMPEERRAYAPCLPDSGDASVVSEDTLNKYMWLGMGGPRLVGCLPGSSSVVRRCATLPHPVGCSTIAVPGLSFRVRNGSGRLPWAMAAANLQLSVAPFLGGPGCVVVWGPVGGRDACVCS